MMLAFYILQGLLGCLFASIGVAHIIRGQHASNRVLAVMMFIISAGLIYNTLKHLTTI